MTVTELSASVFPLYAPAMFAILSENMRRLHPGEVVTEADYRAWLEYQTAHFAEKRFAVLETGETLAGYLQYSVSDGAAFRQHYDLAVGAAPLSRPPRPPTAVGEYGPPWAAAPTQKPALWLQIKCPAATP